MSLKSWISSIITNPKVREARRSAAQFRRQMKGSTPTVHYYHQADDPYSDLAARALPHLKNHFEIEIVPHLVPPPEEAAAPEGKKLEAWSCRDALDLAIGLGLHPLPWSKAPNPSLVPKAESALANAHDPVVFAEKVAAIGLAYRTGDAANLPPGGGDRRAALNEGEKLRKKQGHYLGGTFYFEGEWYWGLDRLNFLEERLAPFAKGGKPPEAFAPRREITLEPGPLNRSPVFEFFPSFRSPYTYIAMQRVVELAKTYRADFRIRFVLPMVMRGLPVPRSKQLYIVLDTKREAERLGLPFGQVSDPVGRPAERGLAVLHHINGTEKAVDFAQSFLKGVFADGIDAGTDKGLLEICNRAGVTSSEMRAGLADESWRDVAETNREEMFAAGLWGVPSFRVDGGPAHWGQDRLWLVEEELRAAAAQEQPLEKAG